tara:strand:- start:70 stop:327 length:258 start_codon:yes stop_codon:yes gene_type:complete
MSQKHKDIKLNVNDLSIADILNRQSHSAEQKLTKATPRTEDAVSKRSNEKDVDLLADIISNKKHYLDLNINKKSGRINDSFRLNI